MALSQRPPHPDQQEKEVTEIQRLPFSIPKHAVFHLERCHVSGRKWRAFGSKHGMFRQTTDFTFSLSPFPQRLLLVCLVTFPEAASPRIGRTAAVDGGVVALVKGLGGLRHHLVLAVTDRVRVAVLCGSHAWWVLLSPADTAWKVHCAGHCSVAWRSSVPP